MDLSQKIKSVLFGVAIGDALGVPVEFMDRESLRRNPVTGMVGYGTYNQPPGTFSDDSSLTFCLAESLLQGFNLNTIGQSFVSWYYKNHWTARGSVFDVGNATEMAIQRLASGIQPELAGNTGVTSNGNGSLMRIAPLIFYLKEKTLDDRFEFTRQVSSLTHGHIRSVLACFYYLEFARLLLNGIDKFIAYSILQTDLTEYLQAIATDPLEISEFDRLLKTPIHELAEDQIESSGYVIHTLEAAIWCLLTTNNYQEAVLKAVNLGDDADTTAAVTGGLAGLLYGIDGIPVHWLKQLARKSDIDKLAEDLGGSKYIERWNQIDKD